MKIRACLCWFHGQQCSDRSDA
uniref:Uncharacterized protein n=1 Tax=Anguilla anguilla TaxID=7936 RepID=A0A0E9TH25_ANGAN